MNYNIDSYGNGFLVEKYVIGDVCFYTGKSMEWKRQPIIHDPFETKRDAEIAIAKEKSKYGED